MSIDFSAVHGCLTKFANRHGWCLHTWLHGVIYGAQDRHHIHLSCTQIRNQTRCLRWFFRVLFASQISTFSYFETWLFLYQKRPKKNLRKAQLAPKRLQRLNFWAPSSGGLQKGRPESTQGPRQQSPRCDHPGTKDLHFLSSELLGSTKNMGIDVPQKKDVI